jgi:hypothetical protein
LGQTALPPAVLPDGLVICLSLHRIAHLTSALLPHIERPCDILVYPRLLSRPFYVCNAQPSDNAHRALLYTAGGVTAGCPAWWSDGVPLPLTQRGTSYSAQLAHIQSPCDTIPLLPPSPHLRLCRPRPSNNGHLGSTTLPEPGGRLMSGRGGGGLPSPVVSALDKMSHVGKE